MKITDLPTDLLCQIAGHVGSIADVLAMRQSCKTLRAATYDRDVWEKAYKRHPWAEPAKEMLGSPEALCKHRFASEKQKERVVKAEKKALEWSMAASYRPPGVGRMGTSGFGVYSVPPIIGSMFFRRKYLEDKEKAHKVSRQNIARKP